MRNCTAAELNGHSTGGIDSIRHVTVIVPARSLSSKPGCSRFCGIPADKESSVRWLWGAGVRSCAVRVCDNMRSDAGSSERRDLESNLIKECNTRTCG